MGGGGAGGGGATPKKKGNGEVGKRRGGEGTRQPRGVGDEWAGCRRMGFTVRSPRQAGVGGYTGLYSQNIGWFIILRYIPFWGPLYGHLKWSFLSAGRCSEYFGGKFMSTFL